MPAISPTLPSSCCSSSSSSSGPSSTSSTAQPNRKRSRPRGLWRGARANAAAKADLSCCSGLDSYHDLTEFDDDDTLSVVSTTSSKRARLSEDTLEEEEEINWDYLRPSMCVRKTPRLDTISTASLTSPTAASTCNYEDWEDLKELFSKAAASYEESEPSETLALLRGVIHECHRFLLIYQDPSVLFTTCMKQVSANSNPSGSTSPIEERLSRDWICDNENELPKPPSVCSQYARCVEIPTAFHAIMGSALFLFGNLIAQDSSLALEGEPSSAASYWLAALDVFETGENLPSRTKGRSCCSPEDWRMAIVWGRTLVCLADETITRTRDARASGQPSSTVATFAAEEPDWPSSSPFRTIASRRPPLTRRMTLSTATPDDLMMLAMDQFSRGIFHMPHSKKASMPAAAPTFLNGVPTARPQVESFSRAKELFTIASEVLLVSERMEKASERAYWASWADSVFNQMKMEADMDAWRVLLIRSRGRCQLIVGTARAEEFDEALEDGDMEVLNTEEAVEARESLEKSIEFFERAKVITSDDEDAETKELQPLLAEAILTLANLTVDETKREELYARARAEGGDAFDLDLMDESD